MVTRYKGMVSKGVWVPGELFELAKEKYPDFNLSHYVSKQLQRDFGYTKIKNEVDELLEKIEPEE